MQFFNDTAGAEYSESQFSVDKGTLQLHSITVSVYILIYLGGHSQSSMLYANNATSNRIILFDNIINQVSLGLLVLHILLLKNIN